MSCEELKNDLKGCKLRYDLKWDAIDLIKQIKDSYINTGPDSYKNWDEWMEIEKKLRNL